MMPTAGIKDARAHLAQKRKRNEINEKVVAKSLSFHSKKDTDWGKKERRRCCTLVHQYLGFPDVKPLLDWENGSSLHHGLLCLSSGRQICLFVCFQKKTSFSFYERINRSLVSRMLIENT